MHLTERLRRIFLRWSQLGIVGLLVLPFAVTSVLGFVWLFERGWLLAFVAASIALVVTGRGLRLALEWRHRRAARGAASDTEDDAGDDTAAPPPKHKRPPPNPDWDAPEARAFARACALAEKRLPQARSWDEIPPEALAVIESVASDLSDGKRGALDFTLPEALLLIDNVALRYRDFLRRNVPFSDQLPVRTMWWAWQQREAAQTAWTSGYLVWRGVRLMVNPALGVLREIERIASAGLQERLSERMRRDAQLALLEEIAQAAVDLYSGRLRFSDAELLELELGTEARDRARLTRPDEPVRIVVIGQVSAGKTTLINALQGAPVAETDMAPTTDAPVTHEGMIHDTPVLLIDTPGLDGSARLNALLLDEMTQADMILWVIRANRSGRDADATLMAAFRAALAEMPARRAPSIVLVASAVDTLMPDWPYPENHLPRAEASRLGRAMASIGADLDMVPIPVSAEPPLWNLNAVQEALAAALDEALMVQRNRRRLDGTRAGLRLRENVSRAARGMREGWRHVTRRIGGRGE